MVDEVGDGGGRDEEDVEDDDDDQRQRDAVVLAAPAARLRVVAAARVGRPAQRAHQTHVAVGHQHQRHARGDEEVHPPIDGDERRPPAQPAVLADVDAHVAQLVHADRVEEEARQVGDQRCEID